MSLRSQREIVLDALRLANGAWVPITHFVYDLGVLRYGGRIHEIRKMGIEVQSREERESGKRKVWYRIIPKEQGRLF